jgi:hypothetical protein
VGALSLPEVLARGSPLEISVHSMNRPIRFDSQNNLTVPDGDRLYLTILNSLILTSYEISEPILDQLRIFSYYFHKFYSGSQTTES